MFFNYSLLHLMQLCYCTILFDCLEGTAAAALTTYSGDVCSDSCFLIQVRSLQRRKRLLLLLLLLRYGHLWQHSLQSRRGGGGGGSRGRDGHLVQHAATAELVCMYVWRKAWLSLEE